MLKITNSWTLSIFCADRPRGRWTDVEAHASPRPWFGSEIQKKMSHVTLVLGVNTALKSRFTIVPKKRTKLPPSEDKRLKTKKPQPEGASVVEPKKKPSFWKRTFSRKSGMSK